MTGPSPGGPVPGGSAPAGVSPPELPPAPEFERRVRFRRPQLIGMVALALVPVTGAFGLLGPKAASVSGSSESLVVHVDYPAVQRFKMRLPLRIEVTDSGAIPGGTIEVALDSSYLTAFSDIAITPGPDSIEGGAHVFVLDGVAEPRTRGIRLEMQAQHFGRHEGHIEWRVFDEAGAIVDAGSLEFATVILP